MSHDNNENPSSEDWEYISYSKNITTYSYSSNNSLSINVDYPLTYKSDSFDSSGSFIYWNLPEVELIEYTPASG